VAPDELTGIPDRNPSTGFENYPESSIIGLEIKNLVKKFGKKKSVSGLSLRMLEGEIFALLGDILNLKL